MAGASTKRSRPAFSPPRPKKSKASNAAVEKTDDTSSKITRRSQPTRHSRSSSEARNQSSNAADSSPAPSDDEGDHDHSLDASPEPDFILAEVTHENWDLSKAALVPSDLLHTILHEHFQHMPKPKLAIDAKQLISKYVDVFVREAIMRSDYERHGGERAEDHDNSAIGAIRSDEWLEVEHLEKIGAQMCLDF